MVLRMKNFDILGVHWKMWLIEGGGHKKPTEIRDCLKAGLEQFEDLREEAWQERRGWCFWKGEGADTPMHTLVSHW